LCVIAGNHQIQAYETESDGTLSFKWQVGIANSESGLKQSRVKFIQDSDFLLYLGSSQHGINRVRISDQLVDSESIDSYLPADLEAQSLEVFRDSIYAGFTYNFWHEVFIFNMHSLKVVRKWEYKGLLAYLDAKPQDTELAIADQQDLHLINYGTGAELRKIVTDYSIEYLLAIHKSNYIFTVQFNTVRVYDFTATGTNDEPIYTSERLGDFSSIVGIHFDPASFTLIQYGNGFGEKFSLTQFSPTLCHNYCSACTAPFSNFHCNSCSGIETNGECVVTTGRSAPPSGFIEDPSQYDYKKGGPTFDCGCAECEDAQGACIEDCICCHEQSCVDNDAGVCRSEATCQLIGGNTVDSNCQWNDQAYDPTCVPPSECCDSCLADDLSRCKPESECTCCGEEC
jgi:hypothetical protein